MVLLVSLLITYEYIIDLVVNIQDGTERYVTTFTLRQRAWQSCILRISPLLRLKYFFQGCRSRFWAGSYSYSTVNILFLRNPKYEYKYDYDYEYKYDYDYDYDE